MNSRVGLDTLKEWPNIPKLTKPVIVTEKLDGELGYIRVSKYVPLLVTAGNSYGELKPDSDRFGFASWVYLNTQKLARILGPGIHYGEWWGHGIKRGYGLSTPQRRFSLFDYKRWATQMGQTMGFSEVPELRCIPLITTLETLDAEAIEGLLDMLDRTGSYAEVGFKPAEGVVVYNNLGMPIIKATLPEKNKPEVDLIEPPPSFDEAVARALERRAEYA